MDQGATTDRRAAKLTKRVAEREALEETSHGLQSNSTPAPPTVSRGSWAQQIVIFEEYSHVQHVWHTFTKIRRDSK
jgi:hypothetical protein